MLNKSIDQFTKFVAETFDTSTQREQVLKMFAEYLMMQLVTGEVDR
ncbi:MAG: hypothetical protein J6S85_05505 [Methanobrevibacter sp.]|nr:hypothetical protein [Methanobrevibacter sp.]